MSTYQVGMSTCVMYEYLSCRYEYMSCRYEYPSLPNVKKLFNFPCQSVCPEWAIFKRFWRQAFLQKYPNFLSVFEQFWKNGNYFGKHCAFLFVHLVTLLTTDLIKCVYPTYPECHLTDFNRTKGSFSPHLIPQIWHQIILISFTASQPARQSAIEHQTSQFSATSNLSIFALKWMTKTLSRSPRQFIVEPLSNTKAKNKELLRRLLTK